MSGLDPEIGRDLGGKKLGPGPSPDQSRIKSGTGTSGMTMERA
jgi:hypothetical protein